MRKIYSLAHQVIVWLGPTADGSDDVMDAHDCVAQILQEFDQSASIPHLLMGDKKWSLPSFQGVVKELVMIYAPLIRDNKIQK